MSTLTPLKRNKPTTRELLAGVKVIDVDTHITEWDDLWTSRAPASLKDRVPQVRQVDGKRTWVIEGDTYLAQGSSSAIRSDGSKCTGMSFLDLRGLPEAHPGAYEVQARVAMMDQQGIFAQVAYPNVLGFGGQAAMKIDADLRVASTKIFNDAMAEFQADSSQRIYPMGLLPWWDVKLAVAEAERCSKMGLRGVNIASEPHAHGLPSLGSQYWDPLWETCAGLNMPVNFHIGASDSSMSWYSKASWPERNPDEKLALGGVMMFIDNLQVMGNILMSRFLERHPGLKIVSVESGAGWVPYLIEALEHMSRESNLEYKVPLLEIFRRQIYVCTFFERRNLVDTVHQVGVDNVMFETDYPHPACLFPDGLDHVTDAVADLTAEERFKIFSGNAAKVYNIDIR